MLSFPLPRTCQEGGINARIADALVWEKIATLMSSPYLLREQAERWLNARHIGIRPSAGDATRMRKEVAKLKNHEERYDKAYGAGLLTLEKLREYKVPLLERVNALESRIAEMARAEREEMGIMTMSGTDDVETFASAAAQTIHTLNFAAKKAIILNVLERIVGTQEKLEVYGYIPLTLNHVEYKTEDRHSRIAKCGEVHSFQRLDAEGG